MSEDSEESLLVNPRNYLQSGAPGQMQYTDEAEPGSEFGTEMNKVPNLSENVQREPNGIFIGHSMGLSSINCQENDHGLNHLDNLTFSQFHADAIEETKLGNFQILATLACAFGMACQSSHLAALYYILPSAEYEYCLNENQIDFLSTITIVGLGFGALLWGGLADQLGRRNTLLSCLTISVIFSTVAAFMPNYETFLMARLCAATGLGGTLPAGASYVCEITPKLYRARMLSIFCSIGLMGGDFASSIASFMIPSTGEMTLAENKKMFSSWHQYLLVLLIPNIFSIMVVFWLPESPLWLLDVDRKSEALAVYQRIFRANQVRPSRSIREIELPGIAVPTNDKNDENEKFKRTHAFFGSFLNLFQRRNLKATVLLLLSWTLALSVCYGLAIYSVAHAKGLEKANYNRNMVIENDLIYKDITFNISIENIMYHNVMFKNCTFQKINLVHVDFDNCTIMNSDFLSVKTSRAHFLNSIIENVKFVDSDISQKNFDNCSKINTEVTQIECECDIDFEMNIYLTLIWEAASVAFVPIVTFVLLVGEFSYTFGRIQTAVTCFAFGIIACFLMGFAISHENIKWIVGIIEALILSGLTTLTLFSVEYYNTLLRCTAMGFFVFAAYFGGLVGAPVYLSIPFQSTYVVAGLSVMILGIPTLASSVLKDPPLQL